MYRHRAGQDHGSDRCTGTEQVSATAATDVLVVQNHNQRVMTILKRMKAEDICSMLSIDIMVKGKCFYGQEPPSGEYTTTECVVNYQLLAVMYRSSPMGELVVVVNRNQLRTMASETVDPIDWSHPPPSWAVPSERHVHSINQCNLSGTRTCNRSMRGNHLAYAATQGINRSMY